LLPFFLVFFLVGGIVFPSPAFAHVFGQPPFLRINGTFTNLYYVPLSSLLNFDLPQDSAPTSYLVGQDLDIALEIKNLPAPPDVVKKTKFTWQFGDGQTALGLEQHHS